ncbi:hypothetical protein IE81DRAFT_347978 [Ceraceosorus guamensis]|uniref:Uncharacterized protein n=1 Tax=Ceraceosorus guamensis TaxID=1522189 RepID=A0A316VWE8_9BASI|nr:hypothetical protein IE81DRAFT_347978 [Ceraceosorus guamensis]PWN41790.1 hypothetical protein IE81DRAFT_347978 [Ceraceosorus guamensis]
MAAVSLHPVASRGGEQSATVVSLQLGVPSAGDENRPSDHSIADDAQPSSTSAEPLALPTVDEAHEWGLQHRDLSLYPVLDELCLEQERNEGSSISGPSARPGHTSRECADRTSIRALSASQLASLHDAYVHLDVPHHVVFPFLHGVDGNNAAQNAFFGAPPSGQPTPNYRGLTIIRADMPTPEQAKAMQRRRASSSASGLALRRASGRPRSGSMGVLTMSVGHESPDETSPCGSASSSNNSSDDGISDRNAPSAANRTQLGHSGSSTSVSSSLISSDMSSLFSTAAESDEGSEMTSASIAWPPSDGPCQSVSATQHAKFDSTSPPWESSTAGPGKQRPLQEYSPQPIHSWLNASVLPSQVIVPPSHSHAEDQDEDLARFVEPKQAPGVSLRNFRIQCARYATISDIAVYCPAGLHDGVLQLARWIRDAQEQMYEERMILGLGSLKYNVFVVTDPFLAFERSHQHLVAVDSKGIRRHHVEFSEREREEMQRLTAASEIDDHVWMGSTADVPLPKPENAGPYQLDGVDHAGRRPQESNPLGFAVCIEAHDGAEIPQPTKLSYASHLLDSMEATAAFEHDSKQALRDLEEDDALEAPAPAAERPSVSLGPSGWTPSAISRICRSGGRRMLSPSKDGFGHDRSSSPQPTTPSNMQLFIAPDNVIHLELPSSKTSFESGAQGRGLECAVEGILNLCAWIKRQAQPHDKQWPTSHVPNGSTFVHGALRGHGSRTSSGAHPSLMQSTTQQLPRRVLLHCGDGYTETSILALAYLMYARELSLPDAYLDLQQRCGRSFFVYGRDLPFLKLIEDRIVAQRDSIRRQREERDREMMNRSTSPSIRSPKGRHAFSWGLAHDESGPKRSANGSRRGSSNRRDSSNAGADDGHSGSAVEQSVWARGLAAASGFVSSSHAAASVRKAPSTPSLSPQSPSPEVRNRTPTPRSPSTPRSPEKHARHSNNSRTPAAAPSVDHRWFYDGRFEGSFPSRILPFLYLGNLNHALNPSMLHALGITHVVSVGETALNPPWAEVNATVDDRGTSMGAAMPSLPEQQNSLWHEERAGRISVLDLKNVSDDGIDPLRSAMREAVEYIESARRSGGAVLVHCRVGVSRSSTIVLAYVMAHLDLNLVESYLLVRSRRLNILIQPHLLFFWELRGWETYLARQKAKRIALLSRSKGNSPEEPIDPRLLDSLSKIEFDTANSPMMGKDEHSQAARGDSEVHPAVRDAFDLDVDLAAGAGSIHHNPEGINPQTAAVMPFGAGSPSGIPATALRLTWGYLCHEITYLNERYFI